MRAIDTNVIVRFLTADHAAQAAVARRAIEAGDIFNPTTLLLETEWVLRSGYRFSSEAIGTALAGLAGLPGVTVEDPLALASALDGMAGD
ncbi:PIN domain-containing protein [Novosphingobium sp.]|uniref:PIN domain-containing protein n=1 Tax=Novosphingobium sp. TaxID=1874826 RepID=UPI002607DB49|nr:PIN domain-containing protein [Novosphingobium sp.]